MIRWRMHTEHVWFGAAVLVVGGHRPPTFPGVVRRTGRVTVARRGPSTPQQNSSLFF